MRVRVRVCAFVFCFGRGFQSGISRFWGHLKAPISCICTKVVDRYGANFRAERALAHQSVQDGRNEGAFAQKCEIHIMAQANKSAMDILDADISGLLSLALSQQGSGTLGTLRSLLGEILVEDLCISYEMPPQGQIAKQRQAIHELFLPIPIDVETGRVGGAGAILAIQRRYVLASMLNGDLQDPQVMHFCAYACCASWEETEMRMKVLVPWALVPHKTPRYCRTRWTNHSASVDWAGLLAMHHNLLPRLIKKWTGAPSQAPAGANSCVDAESAAFLEDLPTPLEPEVAAAENPGPEIEMEMEPDEECFALWLYQEVP